MLIKRPYWQKLIEDAWQQKSIIWLMGVRRVGKTSLCKSIDNIEYFDCELPSDRQLLIDPESFLESRKGKRIALDEIHRLDNPAQLLKIAADHYPTVNIIATGSSTLGASAKFKDTLTGRKKEIWLTPLLLEELENFGNTDLRHRILFGGLPAFFQQPQLPLEDFQEWSDAYWAKDIQDMFSVGKRHSFLKFFELLLANSGGQFDATKYAAPSEVTRQTISNYLDVLEETFIVDVIRPFSTHKSSEIISAPKVYGFDTGFVCFSKGWKSIRQEDLGILWEQCILNELHGKLRTRTINYWRDKKGHEIDFVLVDKNHKNIIGIECKFSSLNLDKIEKNFEAFRKSYPEGENYIVTSDINKSFTKKHEGITLIFLNYKELISRLS